MTVRSSVAAAVTARVVGVLSALAWLSACTHSPKVSRGEEERHQSIAAKKLVAPIAALAATPATAAATLAASAFSAAPAPSQPVRTPVPRSAPQRSTLPRFAMVTEILEFKGACDASGAIPVDEDHFAVADDEDAVLRIYNAKLGGKPVRKQNLTKRLDLGSKGETDIEAAAHMGNYAYWLSSHGRDAKGDEAPNRSLFVHTDKPELHDKVKVHSVYQGLLPSFFADPRLAKYGLKQAASLAPKAPGGLNIEGLTATPEGQMLVGFRSPLYHGRALVLPLLNPDAPLTGAHIQLGAPIELELGGLGIRSLSFWHGNFLVAAGPTSGKGDSRLYAWAGIGGQPSLLADEQLRGLNPEAFFTAESNDRILLLSDDGTRKIKGKHCKRLKRKKRKRFRGVWLKLSP